MARKATSGKPADRKINDQAQGPGSGGSSNTPPKCQHGEPAEDWAPVRVRVDWLQGTVRFDSTTPWNLLIDWLCKLAGDELLEGVDAPRWTGKMWAHSASSAFGMQLRWNESDGGDGGMEGWISLPGSWLGRLSVWDQLMAVTYLVRGASLKATRLDVALDDYRRRVTPGQVFEIATDGHIARYKTVRRIDNWVRTEDQSTKWAPSCTTYLGKPGKDSYVRVYDKAIESDGAIDAIRWEVQFGRNRAAAEARDIAHWGGETEGELSAFLGGKVLSHAEFVEFKPGQRLERRENLLWYQALIDDVGTFARLHVKRAEATVSRAVRWIRKSVAPTLAALGAVGGADWLTHLIASGVEETLGRPTMRLEARRRLWGREGAKARTAALEEHRPRRHLPLAEPKLRRLVDDMTLYASPVLNWALGREPAAGTGPGRPLEPVWVGWAG